MQGFRYARKIYCVIGETVKIFLHDRTETVDLTFSNRKKT